MLSISQYTTCRQLRYIRSLRNILNLLSDWLPASSEGIVAPLKLLSFKNKVAERFENGNATRLITMLGLNITEQETVETGCANFLPRLELPENDGMVPVNVLLLRSSVSVGEIERSNFVRNCV